MTYIALVKRDITINIFSPLPKNVLIVDTLQGALNEYNYILLWKNQGPVVQSIVSLTSSLEVKC